MSVGEAMAGRIFLNYRRADSDAWADRLFDRLIAHFPRENVFLDIDGDIPIGTPWATWLDQEVAKCDLMLSLIGRDWLAEFDKRREPDARDFVRVEIERALARNTPVVPVLLGDAELPPARALPESVRPLLGLQATRLDRGARFHDDAERLIRGVERTIKLSRRGSDPSPARSAPLAAGTVFRDKLRSGGDGPEMVAIPRGRFLMGSPEGVGDADERPQHEVRVPPSAIGRFAVTFDEYDAYCGATGAERPDDRGWGRGRRPAINVSWNDAVAYCDWLSDQTGAAYRLSSEAEWEYACRAETTTAYAFGHEITPQQANFGLNFEGGRTSLVGSYPPNEFGLHDMHGNVWEWCADAWNDSYAGAPDDGSVWTTGDASRAVLRGGAWYNRPGLLRSAYRYGDQRDGRDDLVGFRLSRTLGSP